MSVYIDLSHGSNVYILSYGPIMFNNYHTDKHVGCSLIFL